MLEWIANKVWGSNKHEVVSAKLDSKEELNNDDVDEIIRFIKVFKLYKNKNPSYVRRFCLGWRALWIK